MNKIIKNILITRSKEQARSEFSEIQALGINVIYFPTIKISESEKIIDLKILLSENTPFDFVIFPSFNSAKYFLIALNETFYDSDLIKNKIAVGSKTKAYCEKHKIKIDFLPEEFSAEGVIKLLREKELKGKKILIPKSEIGRKDLEIFLREREAEVFSIPVYKNELPDQSDIENIISKANNVEVDVYLFTSPSSYENFISLMNIEDEADYFKCKLIIPIGKTTKEAIEESGIEVKIIPEEFTINGMISEIKKHIESNKVLL